MNYEAEVVAGAQQVRIEALERDLADMKARAEVNRTWAVTTSDLLAKRSGELADMKARAEVAEAHVRVAESLLNGRQTLILRGEWCRRPEKRNDFALLETRTGAAALLIDRAAVVLACLALGIEVKR